MALDSHSEPSVVRVHIKASKTDPFRRGVFIYLGKMGSDLCLVAAVGSEGSGPFFQFASGSPLCRELLVRHMRAALFLAQVDMSKINTQDTVFR